MVECGGFYLPLTDYRQKNSPITGATFILIRRRQAKPEIGRDVLSLHRLERHLHSNGTRIIIYLLLSKEEQRKRFLQHIVEPEKNWKFSLADVEERKF